MQRYIHCIIMPKNNCRHTVMDRIDETTWQCPKCGVIATSRGGDSQIQNFIIPGIEIKPGLDVKPTGSSAYVGVPKDWIGGEAVVILVNSPPIKVETSFAQEGEADPILAARIDVFMRKNTSRSSKQLSQKFEQPQREIRKICTILIRQGKLRREGKDYFYIDKSSKKTG